MWWYGGLGLYVDVCLQVDERHWSLSFANDDTTGMLVVRTTGDQSASGKCNMRAGAGPMTYLLTDRKWIRND